MDVISELTCARGISYNGGGGGDPKRITMSSTAKSSGVVAPEAADRGHQYRGHAAAGELLLRRTAQGSLRVTTAWTTRRAALALAAAAPPRSRRWHCRVCQVECGGCDGLREHCMSDEHYHGLQLFGLYPDLFADRID